MDRNQAATEIFNLAFCSSWGRLGGPHHAGLYVRDHHPGPEDPGSAMDNIPGWRQDAAVRSGAHSVGDDGISGRSGGGLLLHAAPGRDLPAGGRFFHGGDQPLFHR